MSDIYIVTVEDSESGMFYEDISEFNSELGALDYAARQSIPDHHVVVVYRCEMVRVFEPGT